MQIYTLFFFFASKVDGFVSADTHRPT